MQEIKGLVVKDFQAVVVVVLVVGAQVVVVVVVGVGDGDVYLWHSISMNGVCIWVM